MIKEKIYAATDVDVIMAVASGFVIADIADIAVTLTNGSFSITYAMTDNEIEIVGGSYLVMHIAKDDIADSGIYTIAAIRITDANGKVWGIMPSPETIAFH
ncbi:hypothetical protein Nit79A3_1454 [Nitrosomonas sp. Is79A3]|uniref:hypothetical protein n=1 Tax=Nitrosomonas sp. (strain Is79A3) TaxID=261292 RepID=UPI000215D0CC